jgi:uncharacterized protein YdaU (DUF1376 family)
MRWYKRCGADFIHGTMMLSLEEKGAYSLCLDLIYDRGGPIPDDARWLSGVCGVSMRKWTAIRERLLALGKLACEEGCLTNARAALELVSAERSARERAESGARGGRKRAENAKPTPENRDLDQAELKPGEKIREEEEEPPLPLVPATCRKPRTGGRSCLPEDWALPAIADLPPRARACAEQWTRESYETRGEEFVSFWRSRGRMMKDWRLTWAGRVVDLHSQVMRDQWSGHAPAAPADDLARWTEEAKQRKLRELADADRRGGVRPIGAVAIVKRMGRGAGHG